MIKQMTNFIVLITLPLVLTSCSGLTPDLFRAVDDIATDGVVSIQIDKEAFKKNVEIHLNLDIQNKEPKQL